MIDATAAFRENEILLTGANGFVGKVILGLFLARFPDFKHLHIVMRAKRGVSPRERFERDVLSSPCLKQIVDSTDPRTISERLTMHAGDIGEASFGLPAETIESLKGRVKLILNIAGLVEFTPPVDESFKSNVDGAENVIGLARALGAKLVHVSTCFVCGEADGLVEEDEPIVGFYPRRKSHADQSFRAEDEIRYMRERVRAVYAEAAARKQDLKETRQKLADLGVQRAAQWGWVNTYTYSKSLGEQLIASQTDLEWTIVRPAIVEASLEFPFVGWVEGGRTAAPLVMMAMSGLRHWPLREQSAMELVPVDQVCQATLTAAALLLAGKGFPVYNLGTADRNPVFFRSIIRWIYREYRRQSGKWLPARVHSLTPAESRARGTRLVRRLNRMHELTSRLKSFAQKRGLPFHQRLSKYATNLRMLTRQVNIREQALDLYQPFMYDNRFIFESENIRTATAMLRPEDQAKLPWYPEKIDWRRYWVEHELAGIQKWVEGENKGRSFKI
ncbi:MAG: SDR family oxidoreductase [Bryobacteraceae bacterium]